MVLGIHEELIKDICNSGRGEKKYNDWKPFFAWYPVKIEEKFSFFKKIYRRKIDYIYGSITISEFEYGDIFYVLRN